MEEKWSIERKRLLTRSLSSPAHDFTLSLPTILWIITEEHARSLERSSQEVKWTMKMTKEKIKAGSFFFQRTYEHTCLSILWPVSTTHKQYSILPKNWIYSRRRKDCTMLPSSNRSALSETSHVADYEYYFISDGSLLWNFQETIGKENLNIGC